MNETELLQAMCEAYWKAAPGIASSMRAVLDVLHKAGYRRCAEGQRTTQWCGEVEGLRHDIERHIDSLAKAEAEVERLRAELNEIASVLPGVAYMDPPDGGSPSLLEQFRRMRADLDHTKEDRDELISAVDTWHDEVKRLRGVLKADGDQQAAHIRGLNESWEAEREILVAEIERLTSERDAFEERADILAAELEALRARVFVRR